MKERTFDAEISNFTLVASFICQWLDGLGCDVRAQKRIKLAVDEIFTNICSYAYAPGSGKATVRLEFDEASRTAGIAFIDSGVPYDPLAKPDPDITLSAEERDIGGLGIFMAKLVTDRMDYRRENDRNILTMYKKI